MDQEELNKQYVAELAALCNERVRITCVIGLTTFPLYAILDYFVYPTHLTKLIILRIVCSLIIGTVMFLSYREIGKKAPTYLGIIVFLTAGFTISAMTHLTDGAQSPYYVGVLLVLVTMGVFMPWSLKIVLLVSLSIYAFYIVPIIIMEGFSNLPSFLGDNYFLGTAVFITWLAAFVNERLRRKEFYARYSLAESRDQLAKKTQELSLANVQIEDYNRTLENKVEERTQQLLHSERLAAIGIMSSGIAHEIKNPLSIILWNAEEIINEGDNEAVKNTAEQIKLEAEKLKRLIKGLSKISRMSTDAGSVTPLVMKDIIKETVDALKPLIPVWVKVVLELGEMAIIVEGNKDKLQEVITNLIVNAYQAIPTSGQIVIRTYEDNKKVFVEVEDSGEGISPENLKKIFEPFFTTKSEDRGTGLGLTIIRDIIKEHGGTIDVWSEPGKGTKFTIILPVGRE